ncbi:transcription termination factor MTERF5, chloroplastic-like [Musa acuminata AAA Group]
MKLTQKAPRLLRAKVETTLKPRMRSLQDMGFSVTEIVQLVSTCPTILLHNIQPQLNFLRSLLGSNERLLKACRRNRFLLTSSLAQKIEPNISLLRECGISDERIARMVVMMPGFVVRKNIFIKEVIEHVEELGVPRDCAMFPHALLAVLNISRSKCDATFATLKSFGWSQPDIVAILRNNPCVWKLSKKNISDKMTFLMKEAGCELQYIICYPGILAYSLEKRLRPRHEVVNFLEQNKFLDKGHGLSYVMRLTEQKFMNKYLFPYKEKFTALYSSYVAAVQGKHHVVS